MAASPSRMSGLQTATNTGGQVTMAVNTPTASTSAAQESKTTGQNVTPNLFDPTHIPTIFPRIQSLSRLLIEASSNIHSLSIPRDPSSLTSGVVRNEPMGTTTTTSNTVSDRPDFAMGAMDEDDVNSGFEAAIALSHDAGHDTEDQNIKRTELAHTIVKESRGLRDAFDRAREAVDSLEGGDMDIEEQEKLITLLRDYNQQQRRVVETFAGRRQSFDDVQMSEE